MISFKKPMSGAAIFSTFSTLIFLLLSLFPDTEAKAAVVWLTKSYDFGLMKEEAGPKEGQVSFVNTGPDDVVITGARPSCGCTGVFYSEDPIAPGDTAVIYFNYNPAGRPGKFEKSIRVYIGEKDSYHIGIKGNVLGTPESLDQFYPVEAGILRLSDAVINAGEMTHGATRNFFVNAYNQSPDSIVPKWSVDNPALSVSISEEKMGPGDIATFSLLFNTRKVEEVGPVTIPVTISDGTPNAVPVEVTFKAEVTPDFSRLTPDQVADGPRCYLAPPTLDLGVIDHSGNQDCAFLIENQGKAPLRVMRVFAPQENGINYADIIKIKKYPSSVKVGKTGEVRASLNTSSLPLGPFNIKLNVLTDDPLHPTRTLKVVGIVE